MLGSRNTQHSFAKVPSVNIGRSQFDRSFTVKDAFDFDYLVPIYVDEVLPGDTFNLRLAAFARLATQVVPIMDNMYIDYFFFFVPNRLVWTNWERFNGAQDDPADSISFTMPVCTVGANKPDVGSLLDKYGCPTDVAAGYSIPNTLPFRCYHKIWNDWFRDENLQDSIVLSTDDGPDLETEYSLLKRGKRHDYFTSCLPNPQKGTTEIELPLGTSAPVSITTVASTDLATSYGNFAIYQASHGSSPGRLYGSSAPAGSGGVAAAGVGTADLSTATAATINQLRQALMVQSLLELDARGGTRYVEILRAHFGVTSPDFRLQRAEYLGGGTKTINAHPVPQNSPTSGSNAQAQLAAFATSSVGPEDGIGFSKSFVEHGYVIGLACARADITYQQGLNRMFLRSTRYDFFWPKLQQLGEQAVTTKEIYLTGVSGNDDDVFGYQERYAEYRYKPSEIHGVLRSQYATPVDQWHLAEEFSSQPTLNAAFIVQNTPIERAIAIDTEPDLIFDAYFKLTCARPMMTYSVPATLGRF